MIRDHAYIDPPLLRAAPKPSDLGVTHADLFDKFKKFR